MLILNLEGIKHRSRSWISILKAVIWSEEAVFAPFKTKKIFVEFVQQSQKTNILQNYAPFLHQIPNNQQNLNFAHGGFEGSWLTSHYQILNKKSLRVFIEIVLIYSISNLYK